jgi:hypothetical protein
MKTKHYRDGSMEWVFEEEEDDLCPECGCPWVLHPLNEACSLDREDFKPSLNRKIFIVATIAVTISAILWGMGACAIKLFWP